MDGVLIVDKEKGCTSFDVVARLRGIFGQKKIGHLGTLDPEAEGVLPVLLGRATKLAELLSEGDKVYRTVLYLGAETDTQDACGKVLAHHLVTCTEDEVREAVMSFSGKSSQLTPMYSARKVGGKKLVDLARQGIEAERGESEIFIEKLEILSIHLPRVTLRVRCSKGTYIRTLCEDLGNKLGCGAAMQSLVRTCVGAFRSEDALRLSEIEELFQAGELSQVLIPIESLYPDLPSLHVSAQAEKLLKNGNPLSLSDVSCDNAPADGQLFLVYDVDCAFQAVYRYEEANGRFSPHKMFLS